MMSDTRPIGVFDSGIGGLTVVRELRKQLPQESIIYFGDTARVPYGNKSPATVIRYSLEAANLLLSYDVKSIIVACNTASAHAIDILQKKIKVPVFGVIRPGVDSALKISTNRKILVIGTMGTVRSLAYQGRLKKADEKASIYSQACPLFVPLVEEGWLDDEITEKTIAKYLDPYKKKNIDTVILGCTHYPMLKKAIRKYWPDVNLVDSGVETAKTVGMFLQKENEASPLTQGGKCRFLVSDIAENFREIGGRFLGSSMNSFEIIDMEQYLSENNSFHNESIYQ